MVVGVADASVTGVALPGVVTGVSGVDRYRTRRGLHRYNNNNNNIHHKHYHQPTVGLSWLETIHRRGGAAKTASTSTSTSSTATATATTTSATMDGLKSSLASALAAGCSKTLLAPFDTLKTIQQHSKAASGTSLTFWQAVQLVMERPNGIREFYAGLGVAVIGSMPSVGLYFGVYSYCKRILMPYLETHLGPQSKHKLSSRLLFSISVTTSAAVGNTVASFSRVPYEVVKQKLQTGMYTSTWQALTHMAQQDGLRAFFPLGGISIQMLRDIPYAMVTLLSYEILKDALRPLKTKQHYPEGLIDALTGALAGGLGSYVTNPLDVIKTRLQTNPDWYRGSIGVCARDVWMEGGSMAFLRGSIPRLLHKVPANGCFFLFYEFFRAALHVRS